MEIVRIVTTKLEADLKTPFKTSLRQVDSVCSLAVEVHLENGLIGYGEAAPTAVITGETMASLDSVIVNLIAPAIVGLDIFRLEEVFYRIDHVIIGNTSAKAAVDIAIYDVYCRLLNIPLYKLLGGYQSACQSDVTISLNPLNEMIKSAQGWQRMGFNHFKIKVGYGKGDDIAMIRSLRKALGKTAVLRIDANQAWSAKEAVEIAKAIESETIELIEQPVYYKDLDAMAYVTQNTLIPIMADESVFDLVQAETIISRRVADIINIKLMKTGGIHTASLIADFAAAHGIPCMMGCMMESGIATLAAAHLAVSRRVFKYIDLDVFVLLKSLPFRGDFKVLQSTIQLGDSAGLGIDSIMKK